MDWAAQYHCWCSCISVCIPCSLPRNNINRRRMLVFLLVSEKSRNDQHSWLMFFLSSLSTNHQTDEYQDFWFEMAHFIQTNIVSTSSSYFSLSKHVYRNKDILRKFLEGCCQNHTYVWLGARQPRSWPLHLWWLYVGGPQACCTNTTISPSLRS